MLVLRSVLSGGRCGGLLHWAGGAASPLLHLGVRVRVWIAVFTHLNARARHVQLRSESSSKFLFFLSLDFITTIPFVLIIGMGNGCLPSRSPLSSCSGSFLGGFRTTAMATTIMRSRVWRWNVRIAQVPTLNLQNCATPELSSSRRYILKALANHSSYSAVSWGVIMCFGR